MLTNELGPEKVLEPFLRTTKNQEFIIRKIRYIAEDEAFFEGIQDPKDEELVQYMPPVDRIMYEGIVKKNLQLHLPQKNRLWHLWEMSKLDINKDMEITPKSLKSIPLLEGETRDTVLNLDYVTLSRIINSGIPVNSITNEDELLKLVQSIGMKAMNSSKKDKNTTLASGNAKEYIEGLEAEDIKERIRDIQDEISR